MILLNFLKTIYYFFDFSGFPLSCGAFWHKLIEVGTALANSYIAI